MSVKLKVHDEATGLTIGGTEYKAKDGVVEVSELHAEELTSIHGYQTTAQHEARARAQQAAKRQAEKEQREADQRERDERVAEAKRYLESQGIKVPTK